MRNPEQNEILGAFLDLLTGPTGDGGNKRAAGVKPLWKVDPSHPEKMLNHLRYWQQGELVDKDSGCHPLQHLAWRALAIAYQETHHQRDVNPPVMAGQLSVDECIEAIDRERADIAAEEARRFDPSRFGRSEQL